jgi:hypothetical protein
MRAGNLLCNNDKMADVAGEHEPTSMVPFNSMHNAMFKIFIQHAPQHATFKDPLMPSNLPGNKGVIAGENNITRPYDPLLWTV